MRLLLLMILFTLCQTALAVDCEKAITTLDINECTSIEQQKVENQLNAAYKKIIQKFEHPEPDFAEHYSATKQALVEATCLGKIQGSRLQCALYVLPGRHYT